MSIGLRRRVIRECLLVIVMICGLRAYFTSPIILIASSRVLLVHWMIARVIVGVLNIIWSEVILIVGVV